MARARWTLAWAFWCVAAVVAVWGGWDAPRRGETGVQMRGTQVGSVQLGSSADLEAGLEPGDRLALPGRPGASSVRNRLTHLRAGETIPLLVQASPGSGDEPRRVRVTAAPPSLETLSWRLAWSTVALALLALACVVGRARRDALAAVFFLWCTVVSLAVTPWPLWPMPAAAWALEAIAGASALFLPVLLLHFFALFPEGRGRRRTRLARVLYAAALTLALLSPVGSRLPGGSGDLVAAAGGVFFAVAVGLAVTSFVISYRQAKARHRGRLQVLLWCSILGLAPVVALTLASNLAAGPIGAPWQAAALLFLVVPLGFAYAIEVHQVFDFRWRRGREPARNHAVPLAPPVFEAGDARATVDAVAADLHARLGLSHCAVYWRNGGPGAELVTWLGDPAPEGGPESVPDSVVQFLDRLRRPASLDELRPFAEPGAGVAFFSKWERTGGRTLVPIFSSHELRAVLALGGRLADDLGSARRRAELGEYVAHAALAVEHAEFHDDRVHRARMDRELELARGIQERLLPRSDPSYPTIACSGASIPSGRVCGDYFDYVDLGERRFGVAVADVCGKGVPAALLVSHVQAGLQLRAAGGTAPSEVIAGLNRDLARFRQPEKFVCLLYAVVDTRARLVRWANGGLNPPLYFSPDGEVTTLPIGDLILGVDAETEYHEWSARLAPGEGILFHTDGILDARRGEEVFGGPLLEAALRSAVGLRAPRLRDRILAAARDFHATGPGDDMTAVVLKAH